MTLWLSRLRQEVHGRMSSPDPTGPASGPLFADPIGHALIVVGIVLQTIGYFVIRTIIQIQV